LSAILAFSAPGESQRPQRSRRFPEKTKRLLSSIYRARARHAASVKAWGDRRPVAARRAINRQPGNRGFGSWSSFVGRWPSGSATVSLHRGGRRCLIGALSNLRCRHAALWSGHWRLLTIVLARPSSPGPSEPNSMPADRPISRRSADASRRIQPPFPTSSVEVAPLQLYDELSTAQLVGVA
jgi:hypothetical protein